MPSDSDYSGDDGSSHLDNAGAEATDATKDKGGLSAFLTKTYQMIEAHESVHWSDNGRSFTVTDADAFSSEVLPRFFRHNKFPSFIRQLNMYGFHKVVPGTPGQWEFRHEFFQRDRQDLMANIRRKGRTGSSLSSRRMSRVRKPKRITRSRPGNPNRTASGEVDSQRVPEVLRKLAPHTHATRKSTAAAAQTNSQEMDQPMPDVSGVDNSVVDGILDELSSSSVLTPSHFAPGVTLSAGRANPYALSAEMQIIESTKLKHQMAIVRAQQEALRAQIRTDHETLQRAQTMYTANEDMLKKMERQVTQMEQAHATVPTASPPRVQLQSPKAAGKTCAKCGHRVDPMLNGKHQCAPPRNFYGPASLPLVLPRSVPHEEATHKMQRQLSLSNEDLFSLSVGRNVDTSHTVPDINMDWSDTEWA